MLVRPPVKSVSKYLNHRYLYGDADTHVTVELTGSNDRNSFGGLIFWARGSDNFYVAGFDGTGSLIVDEVTDGKLRQRYHSPRIVRASDPAQLEVVTGEPEKANEAQAAIFVNRKFATRITSADPQRSSKIGILGASGGARATWKFSNLYVAVPPEKAGEPVTPPAEPEIPKGEGPPSSGFYASGDVVLSDASIDGNLQLIGAHFADNSMLRAGDAVVKVHCSCDQPNLINQLAFISLTPASDLSTTT